jgi:hypothetical protein
MAPVLVAVCDLSGHWTSMLISMAPDFIVMRQLVAFCMAALMAWAVSAACTVVNAPDDPPSLGLLLLLHPAQRTAHNISPNSISLCFMGENLLR